MFGLRNSLSEIYTLTQQVPNLAPNERFLPNADYGRLGALKLVDNIFVPKITQYINASGSTAWADLGRYHYYILGKTRPTKRNEFIRVSLTDAPDPNTYYYTRFDRNLEKDGPLYQQEVIQEISEQARIYGFPVQTVLSSILTIAEGLMDNLPMNSALYSGQYADGALMARYNFSLLEALWGIRGSGFPKTFRFDKGVGARQDYGKGYGKKRSKKRRRY